MTTRTSSEEPPVDATESPLQEETGIAPNLFSTNSNNRQTILASVRKFLEDPAVKDAPYDKKRAFLESKGISSDVMDEILGAVSMLAQDQYGNYVVQVGFSFQGLPLWMHICHYLSD